MKYDELYSEFKKIMNTDELVIIQKNNNVDESDGMHILFGMVVTPFLEEQLKENNTENLNSIFNFFEDMEKLEDNLIQEVLEFTVLENLLSYDSVTKEKAIKYMRPETKKVFLTINNYYFKPKPI